MFGLELYSIYLLLVRRWLKLVITILQPVQYISALWGDQKVREDVSYRLMKYVIRVDCEGKVLLHNSVTRQLVELNQEEQNAINRSDSQQLTYSSSIKELVESHFLVPELFDEHQQVEGMRYILRRLEGNHSSKHITKYTILTTTACNARCYYCFEHGVESVTMSPQTADDVVEFINAHSGNERAVHITWFGGEPTLASDRIDQISEGLRKRGIEYFSDMTTNGYLFDKEMVDRARNLWNLKYLQICFDGLEVNHNRIKSYVGARDNPYQRTFRNIGLLLEEGIRVGLRMNFDINNYQDFEGLVQEAAKRFPGNSNLSVYAFPVIGEYKDTTGHIYHGNRDWFEKKIAELNEYSRQQHMYHERQRLPFMKHHCCDAENDEAITVLPDGNLVRCCQCLGVDQLVGNIWEGITNHETYQAWKKYADYDNCRDCVYFPSCPRVEKCPGKDRCQFYIERSIRDATFVSSVYRDGTKRISI